MFTLSRALVLSLCAAVTVACSPKASSPSDTAPPVSAVDSATFLLEQDAQTGNTRIGVSGVMDLKGLSPGMSLEQVRKTIPSLECVSTADLFKKLQALPDTTQGNRKLYTEWTDQACYSSPKEELTFADEPAFYEVLLKDNQIQSIQIAVDNTKNEKVIEGLMVKFKLQVPPEAGGLGQTVAKMALAGALAHGIRDEKANQLLIRVIEGDTTVMLSHPDLIEKAENFAKEVLTEQSRSSDL